MIRVLVADDQPMARERLVSLLAAEPGVELVGTAASGTEAVAQIRQHTPDLVFLDLQMPGMDGFQVIEAIGVDRMPPTVFVTAYDEYAVRAFEVEVIDYLLKPFGRHRFQSALARARNHLEQDRQGELAQRLAALLQTGRPDESDGERLLVKSGGRVSFVDIDAIDWVEAEGNYVRVHAGAQAYVVRETMTAFLERLGGRSFCRIHRSRIVNVARVKELMIAGGGDYQAVLWDGTRLGLSRLYREALQEKLTRRQPARASISPR